MAIDHAVVVIHGIGKQQAGATLSSFTGGLIAAPGGEVVEVTVPPARVPFGEPKPPRQVRLRSGAREVDVYEVYWSPDAANQTTARSVLTWLLKLSFIPSRKAGTKLRQSLPKSFYDRAIVLVALGLAGALVLIALAAFSVLAEQASCVNEDREGCEQILSGLHLRDRAVLDIDRSGELIHNLGRSISRGTRNLVSTRVDSLDISKAPDIFEKTRLLEALAAVGVAYLAGQLAFGILAGLRRKGVANKLGTVASVVFQIGFLIVLGGVLGPGGIGLSSALAYALTLAGSLLMILLVPRALRWPPIAAGAPMLVALPVLLALLPFVSTPVASFAVLTPVVYAILRAGASFLSESVGDVQVYTTRDPNRKYFPVRAAVQATSERVFAEIAARGYRTVTIVGHSLGSVIALDVLTLLEERTPNLLRNISTLVTFGSPLEKITYFFEQPPLPSGRGAGGAQQLMEQLGEARLDQLRQAAHLTWGMRWINIWYANDPVADPIVSYGKNARFGRGPLHRFWGDNPAPPDHELVATTENNVVVNLGLGWRWRSSVVWPHSDYWSDPAVSTLLRRLIFS